jgi:cytidylate kinase
VPKHPVVTIDGPAGSGKSTAARALARRLGFVHVDTGALYRTVTLLAVERGVDLTDEEALAAVVADIDVRFEAAGDGLRVFSGGRDVSEAIRTPELTAQVRHAAGSARVRRALRPVQRTFAESSPVVMEGRDIGTVIFPDAEVKFFLDAPLPVRAERRWRELREAGAEVTLEEVERAERERDASDTGREVAPLRRAEDAVAVDTGPNTVEETADILERIAREKLRSRVSGAGCRPGIGDLGSGIGELRARGCPVPGPRTPNPERGTRNPPARRSSGEAGEPGTARRARPARSARGSRIGLWYRFCRLVCRWTCRAFFRLRTWGIENVPDRRAGGVILACNHQSYLDPPLATCMLERQCRYMARSSLFGFAPFAWLIRSVGAIPIERGESDRAALRRAQEALGEGWLLTLFPEGTRTRDGYLGEVKPGVGSLAVRAGVPVLPCYLHGAYDVWPRSRRLPRPSRVGAFYGKPIAPPDGEGLSRRERARLVNEEMTRTLRQLQELAFEVMPLRTRSAPGALSAAPRAGAPAGDSPVRAAGEDGQAERSGGTGEESVGSAPGALSDGQS